MHGECQLLYEEKLVNECMIDITERDKFRCMSRLKFVAQESV